MDTTTLSDKDAIVLKAVKRKPQTADEFVNSGNTPKYVNSWAPTFTTLKQRGYLETTGETRLTKHGSHARVLKITQAGLEALANV